MTIFSLRALRREGICVFESFEMKMYLRALWGECAAASCWPGRINSFPWGREKGRRRGECWSYWCVPLLICRLLDYSQVPVAMILRASRKCRVCWFPDVTVDLWPPSVDAGTCRSVGITMGTGHRWWWTLGTGHLYFPAVQMRAGVAKHCAQHLCLCTNTLRLMLRRDSRPGLWEALVGLPR